MSVNFLACRYGKYIIYQRYVLAVILVITLANLYGMRLVSSNSLIYLSDQKKVNQTAVTWERREKMLATCIFHIGYSFTHVPFGILCDLHGARHVLTLGVLISSILTFLTPMVVTMKSWLIIGNRLALGMAQGACMPSFFNLISYWSERKYLTAFATFSYSGGCLGNLVGAIVSYYFQGKLKNWHLVYYYWGCSGLVCALLLESFVFSRPATHPFVSPKEKTLLQNEMGFSLARKVPLKQILTDSGVWAISFGQIGHNWLLHIVLTKLPHYFIKVAQPNEFEKLMNVIVSQLIFWVAIVTSGVIGNYCINKRYIPVIYLRTICNAIGCILPSIIMLIMTFSGSNMTLINIWVILSMIARGPTYSGLKVNIFDLTKYYAGTVKGIENGVGGIVGIFSEVIMYQICPTNSIEEWRKVGLLTFALCTFTATMYFVWAKGERGKWDYMPHEKQ